MAGPESALLALILYVFNPVELGVQLTGTHLHKIDMAPLGIGARFFLNFTEHTSLDAELTRYSGETSALLGMKSGLRSGRFGMFAKTRVGMWHFGGQLFSRRLSRRTVPAADLGGVLEYYPSSHTTIRIDLGDTILFYGPQSLIGITGRLGTVHNFQPGLGFSFRF